MKLSILLALDVAFSLVNAGCNLPFHASNPEYRAFIEVVQTKQAEGKFYSMHHRYGTFEELGPREANLLAGHVVGGRYAGYIYRLDVSRGHYTLVAAPDAQSSLRRSYFCDETGILRQSFGPSFATAESPPIR